MFAGRIITKKTISNIDASREVRFHKRPTTASNSTTPVKYTSSRFAGINSGIISIISAVFVKCATPAMTNIAAIAARPTNERLNRPDRKNLFTKKRTTKVPSRKISGAIICNLRDCAYHRQTNRINMKRYLLLFAVFSLVIAAACDSTRPANNATTPKPSPSGSASAAATPVPTPSIPKNADYDAKGVVTKINLEAGSVEMDHEEIKGLMPPMRMEFFVSDKKILDGIKVGDKIDFVLRYKDYTETVVAITKAK